MRVSTRSANPILRRVAAMGAALLMGAVALTGCSSSSDAEAKPTQGTSGSGGTSYPLTLESPYGSTELKAKPQRVAVVSATDLDIALSLGVVPVTSPKYGDSELDSWTLEAADKLGAKLTTYNSADGVDYEAIAASNPDVILATSGWTLDADYPKLSKIAPVVSYQGKDGISSMSWDARTREAAAALDLKSKGEEVVAGVEKKFADAKAANPEFVGKSFTYAVIHPEQITYESYKDSDTTFFKNLGFVQPKEAEKFSLNNSAVSRENLDVLDADVLLVGYPFGDEGVMSKEKFESDPLFKQIPAVAKGHYAVVDDAVASPLAYPTPLSQPWTIDKLVPVLAKAVAGK